MADVMYGESRRSQVARVPHPTLGSAPKWRAFQKSKYAVSKKGAIASIAAVSEQTSSLADGTGRVVGTHW